MSATKKRYKVSKKLMEEEYVDADTQAQCLQTALYKTYKDQPFVGAILQCLNIMYSHMVPTAGVAFNNESKRWDMYINPFFYCKKLDANERVGVLVHEISHVLHKHPLRVPFIKLSPYKRTLMNIAADMAINQYIKHLPKGCPKCPPPEKEAPCPNKMCPGKGIFVEDFYQEDEKTKKKIPFKHNMTMEYYYEELLKKFDDPDKDETGGGKGECQTCGGTGKQKSDSKDGNNGQGDKQEDGDGDGEGNNQGAGKPCPDCNGQGGNAGGGAHHPNLPSTMDVHDWDGAGEEEDMLDAVEDLVKRAMVKESMSYDELPGNIKELLQDIEARKAELNYRALILSAIKRSASGHSRVSTWSRKSKRYGHFAPGSKIGELPKLHQFIDTSGSISVEEANEFLDIVDNFLRAGSRKCRLNLFHTENYYSEEYRLGKRLKREEIQSGGTCLEASMREIAKRRPDLAIILTDGYYGNVEVEKMIGPNDKFPQCLFIISREGTADHPLKRLGETIKIPSKS